MTKGKGLLLESAKKQITMFIARMITKDLQPQYKVPHRTTFSRTVILELYQSTVDSLKVEIAGDMANSVESITFTNDMWTSRANQSYIALTCHLHDAEFHPFKAFTLVSSCAHLPAKPHCSDHEDLLDQNARRLVLSTLHHVCLCTWSPDNGRISSRSRTPKWTGPLCSAWDTLFRSGS
ncbi:hypothetical protein HPB48_012382 [Haemaphysalis longicornis]|uniref:Uncharacterized protein n=1 Tax=Haemaphysalis longicornis TaxID=44386 RepID=A0A9J6G1K6_HAELO|nr:hypothetical protein HPB48_012382 [Haemaphysalis longicornis]